MKYTADEADRVERDMRIIRSLAAKPQAKRSETAKDARVSVPTLQRRLKHFQESGLVKFQFVISPDNPFFPTRSLIGIDVGSAELVSERYGYYNQQEFVSFLLSGVQRHEDFAKYVTDVIVEFADVVLGGSSDIVVIVSAVSSKALAAYVTLVIRKLPGVLKTNTATLVSYGRSLSRPTSGDSQGKKKAIGKKQDTEGRQGS